MIVEEFERFYTEFLKYKEQALRSSYQEVILDQQDEDPHMALVIHMQHELSDFFSKQHFRIMHSAFSIYTQEMQYIMVSLCDDVMISLDWKGREFWKNNPLEAKLFSTQIAGEAIFKRIDQILHDYDPKQQDIGLLYLFILSLGFKGRYVDLPETCDHYRMHLYYFINKKHSDLYHPGRLYVNDQLYQHTLSTGPTLMLPSLQKWFGIFTATFIVYCLVNFALWHDLSSDLRQYLNDLFLMYGGMPS